MPGMRATGVTTAVRVTFVTIVVLASACQTAKPELSPDPGELRGDWLVVEVNGTQSRELGVVVTFDDGTVDTANVCNGLPSATALEMQSFSGFRATQPSPTAGSGAWLETTLTDI